MKKLIAICLCLLVIASVHAADFGLIKVAVAPLRENPSHSAEQGSQLVLGTPVLLDSIARDEWWHLQSPDGYSGYVHVSGVEKLTEHEARRWRSSKRLFNRSFETFVINGPLNDDGIYYPIAQLPPGGIVEVADLQPSDPMMGTPVKLPDGRTGFVNGALEEDMELKYEDTLQFGYLQQQCRERSKNFLGIPYLWGGNTTNGIDCSGLTQLIWFTFGVQLPRNASQQALCGKKVESIEKAVPGDLLFFADESGHISHVGFYIGGNKMIHAKGDVHIGVLDPTLPLDEYSRYYLRPIAEIRRVSGERRVAANPLYFNQ